MPSHFVSYVVIAARPTSYGSISIDINNRHLDGHAIEINNTPHRLRRSSRCYTLINAVYKIVKSSGGFANQPNPVPHLNIQLTSTFIKLKHCY